MNNFNYFGNIIINNDNINRYQRLYASQVYQTFFGIYANFTIDDQKPRELVDVLFEDIQGNTITEKRESLSLREINLQLINFKGLLNIGFPKGREENKYKIKTIFQKDADGKPIKNRNKTILITLFVRAGIETDIDSEAKLSLHGEDLNPILTGDRIIVSRELLSLKGQKYSEVLELKRHPKKGTLDEGFSPIVNGVFDEEFYYRNGMLLRRRGDGDFALDATAHKYEFKDAIPELLDGTPSCKDSDNKVTVIN